MIRRLLALCLLSLVPAVLAAQASQFGVRSLGLPALPVSARSDGMAGGFGFFDPESALNPAAVSGLRRTTAGFNVRQFWRTSENPFGSASGNDTQFPLVMVGGPLGPKFNMAVSVAAYTDRTFALTYADTIQIRGEPVGVQDTVFSRGGINDIRVAVSYFVTPKLVVAGAVHALTGSNRFEYRRVFSDSAYASLREETELSFAGPGLSAGVLAEVTKGLRLSGIFRWDGDVKFNKDSVRLASLRMPFAFGGGLQWQSRRLMVSGHALARNWAVADSQIKARGGVGSVNTVEYAAGMEYATHPASPLSLPLRAGVRFAQLPFPLVTGSSGHETIASLGTGFRFTGGRGSVDVALQHAWRSQAGGYEERAFSLSLGVGIRP